MKKRLFSLILIGSLFASVLPTHISTAESQVLSQKNVTTINSQSNYVDGTVLVTLATPEDTALTKEGRVSFDKNMKVEDSYNLGDASLVADSKEEKDFLADKTLYISEISSDSYSTEELMEELDNNAYVLTVEPDYVQYLNTTSDELYSDKQWYLDGTGAFSGETSGINHSFAKEKTKTGTPVVAVMDTGINYEHEDLSEAMWINPYTSQELSGTYGYNFVSENANCMDDEGHGTHCAGVIAADADNQKGIAGISNAKLMALKVFNSEGETTNSTIVKGLNYILQAKNLGVNITAVNCSWGGGSSSLAMAKLIQQIGATGTIFVFASGNDATNHDTSELICPYDLYQGSFGSESAPTENRNYMIITGASDCNDNPSYFSDYGKSDVDLFAPGENILSTYLEDTYFPEIYPNEKNSELTEHFLDFDAEESTNRLYTDEELDIDTPVSASISYLTDADYYNSNNSGSILWDVDLGNRPAHSDKETYLYLDVTDAAPDIESTYYVSMQFGSLVDDSVSWNHVVKKSSGEYGSENNRFYTTSDGKIYFKILGIVSDRRATGTSSYYLDNIGISVANPNTNEFGKYEVLKGTSMAAPMVTGAVALLSEIYPEDSAYNRRNRLLTCVRTTTGVTGKCITDGVLDLSKMDSYVPVPDPVSTVTPTESTVTSDISPQTPVPTTPKTTTNTLKKVSVKKVKISKKAKKIYKVKKKTKSGKVKKVKKTKNVKIKNGKIVLRVGNKLRLKASVSPTKASNKKVRWTSSKKRWASITQKGVVTAKKKGRGHTVKITAKAKDGSGKKATIKIKIRK